MIFAIPAIAQDGPYQFNAEYKGFALWDAAQFSIIPQSATFDNPGSYIPQPSSASLTRVPPMLSYFIDGPGNYGTFRLDYIWAFLTTFLFKPKGDDSFGFDHSIFRGSYGGYIFGKKRDWPVNIGFGLDADLRAAYAITGQNLDSSYDHKSFASVGIGPNMQIRINPFRWLNITPSVSHVFYLLPKYGSKKTIQGYLTTFSVPIFVPVFKSRNKSSNGKWGLFLRPEFTVGKTHQIGTSPIYFRDLEHRTQGINIGVAYR
jgi:hypothetical protein